MATYKQKIETDLCPYALQECAIGKANCPTVEAADMSDWKNKAEARANCPNKGADLSQIAYKKRYKVVREKPELGKEVF